MTRETVFRGKIVTLERETVTLPNGHTTELEIVRHPGGAAVVALDDKGRVCLLRQYRYVVGGWIWEIPAGKLEPDEPPLMTAQRELEEEAGLTAARWEPLGKVVSSPGIFTEVIHLFLARDLKPTAHNHEHGELIEVHWFDLAEALAMITRGEIIDGKTVLGLLLAQSVRNG
jgi:ADP-ribose pyrophosphatase